MSGACCSQTFVCCVHVCFNRLHGREALRAQRTLQLHEMVMLLLVVPDIELGGPSVVTVAAHEPARHLLPVCRRGEEKRRKEMKWKAGDCSRQIQTIAGHHKPRIRKTIAWSDVQTSRARTRSKQRYTVVDPQKRCESGKTRKTTYPQSGSSVAAMERIDTKRAAGAIKSVTRTSRCHSSPTVTL